MGYKKNWIVLLHNKHIRFSCHMFIDDPTQELPVLVPFIFLGVFGFRFCIWEGN